MRKKGVRDHVWWKVGLGSSYGKLKERGETFQIVECPLRWVMGGGWTFRKIDGVGRRMYEKNEGKDTRILVCQTLEQLGARQCTNFFLKVAKEICEEWRKE